MKRIHLKRLAIAAPWNKTKNTYATIRKRNGEEGLSFPFSFLILLWVLDICWMPDDKAKMWMFREIIRCIKSYIFLLLCKHKIYCKNYSWISFYMREENNPRMQSFNWLLKKWNFHAKKGHVYRVNYNFFFKFCKNELNSS